MSHRRAAGIRVESSVPSRVVDRLSIEAPLEICINGKAFSVTMRTPGDDVALVKGLLFTEGVVSPECLDYAVRTGPAPGSPGAIRARVEIPPVFVCENLMEKRSLISSASCGLCGKQGLDDIEMRGEALRAEQPFVISRLPRMAATMRCAQATFDRTGGCHAAAAFAADGTLLRLCEDIGRHNAVDKVIGGLLSEVRLEKAAALLVSGRISFEIVAKAYRAGIVFLAAVSAPSSLAVDMGEVLGMTIIGFCREQRATVYSHPEQVTFQEVRHGQVAVTNR